MSKIQQTQQLLSRWGVDAVWITKPENRRYFSGFTGTEAVVVLTHDRAYLLTDSRYSIQAKQQCAGFDVVILKPSERPEDWLGQLGFQTIGIEADYLTVSAYRSLKEKVQGKFVPVDGFLSELRLLKNPEEILAIKKAAEIADRAFQHILSFLKPGERECDIALELEFFMRKAGASGLSFESIVASGVRSAMPHGVASEKRLELSDFVTLDFGCIYDGYCSDMTRTVVVGTANEQQRKLYQTVLDAQMAGLNAIGPRVLCRDVDNAARSVIVDAGHGPQFGHGTGHGVGLEIHEAPRLAPGSEWVLQPGMVVTVEPGVYIDGFGGVRIEDLVLVTENGYEILSKSPKALLEL